MNPDTEDYLPTRESLLERLRNWEDQASWHDFFETYWKLIYKFARRAGLAEAEAQDVVQETVITVARKLPEFHYDPARGSFKAWLHTVAHSRIQDHFRRKHYRRDGQQLPREQELNTSLLEAQAAPATPDLSDVWDEEWHQSILERATERVKLAVSPKQYQMFYLHGLQGMPAAQVAARLNVSRAEVYTAKYRVALLLKKEIKALESRSRGESDRP
jgi:RNA polymerase sigma-70 factor (ECF subfamily)